MQVSTQVGQVNSSLQALGYPTHSISEYVFPTWDMSEFNLQASITQQATNTVHLLNEHRALRGVNTVKEFDNKLTIPKHLNILCMQGPSPASRRDQELHGHHQGGELGDVVGTVGHGVVAALGMDQRAVDMEHHISRLVQAPVEIYLHSGT